MVAHAVYVCISLPACASEGTPGSSVAIAGDAAGRTGAKDAAGSSGTAVVIAGIASNGIVVVTNNFT